MAFAFYLPSWLRKLPLPKSLGFSEFLMLRGAIVGVWAGLESVLDEANHVAWTIQNGTAGEIPVSFKRKVTYFRRSHRDVDVLKTQAQEAEFIVSDLVRLMEDRHYLVHGYLSPAESTFNSFMIRKNDFGKHELNTSERVFTSQELHALLNELIDIATKATNYMAAVRAEIVKHRSHNTRR